MTTVQADIKFRVPQRPRQTTWLANRRQVENGHFVFIFHNYKYFIPVKGVEKYLNEGSFQFSLNAKAAFFSLLMDAVVWRSMLTWCFDELWTFF